MECVVLSVGVDRYSISREKNSTDGRRLWVVTVVTFLVDGLDNLLSASVGFIAGCLWDNFRRRWREELEVHCGMYDGNFALPHPGGNPVGNLDLGLEGFNIPSLLPRDCLGDLNVSTKLAEDRTEAPVL